MAAATSTQLCFLTDAAHLLRQSAPQTSAYLMSRRIDLAASSQSVAAPAGSSIAALPQTDVQRQHVCTCCGLILIPGCDGTTLTIQPGRPAPKNKSKSKKKLELERKRKRDEKDGEIETAATTTKVTETPRIQKPHTGIKKVYACGACGRETRIALPPPPLSKHRRQKAAAAAKATDSRPTATDTSLSPTIQTPTTTSAALPAITTTTTTTVTTKAASNANSKKRAKNRKAGLLALLDKSRGAESSGLGSLNLSFDDFRKK